MKKHSKKLIIILAFLIVFNLSACSNQTSQNKISLNPDETVATIGDQKISVAEFTFYLKCAKKDMENMSQINTSDKNAVKKFWKTKVAGNDPVETARSKAFESLKELKILLSKAKEDNVQITQSDLDKVKSYMDKLVTESGGDRTKAEEKAKAEYGVNLSQYESIYKDYVFAYDDYKNSLMDNINISDQAIKEFYDKNIDLYDTVTVKHILISTQDSTNTPLPEDKIPEKEKLAQEILDKVKSGANFDVLAKQYSDDPGSKDKGGEYTFARGQMVKEFEDWSFSAKPGDIGLVKSEYGFHIIKFVKKETFESQKADIKHEMQLEQHNKDLEAWKNDKKYELKTNNNILKSISVI